MKMLFTFLAFVLSVSAFAAKSQYIYCTVGIEGDRYVELEFFFPTNSTVNSFLVEEGIKIPTLNNLEINDQARIVTSYVGLSDVKTIIVPIPTDLFTAEEGSFWIFPAAADDKDVWAACVN